VIAFDYIVDFDVDDGADVSFIADGQDGQQWENVDATGTPVVFAGVTTNPDPYNGQFAQLDVLDVAIVTP
jgi:hypothetical protein